MANHYYKNFPTVKARTAFQDAVIDATNKMPLILKDARANTKDNATRAYRMYFGEINKSRMETVIGILSRMDYVLSAGKITFQRVLGGDPNECAATHAPYGAWSDQSPKQMAQSSHKHQDAYVMNVGDAFYTATNSIDRTIKSAQFNTVCHELSHLVGNTDDPVYGNVQVASACGQ